MDSELLKKIWPVFVEEAREHLQQISAGILELEQAGANRPAGLLEGLKRTAHGLKGSAASLGLSDIEKLAHALEDAMVSREKAAGFESTLVESMLAAVDAAEDALNRGDAGGEPNIPDLEAVLGAMIGAAGGKPPVFHAVKPAEPKPEPKPEPSALEQIWPIFRGEAVEHVEQLKRACQDDGPGWSATLAEGLAKVAASLKGSASMLGLGEMGELAGKVERCLTQCGTDGQMPAARLEELRSAVAGLESAIGAADGGQQPAAPAPASPAAQVRRPPAAGALATVFLGEARETLTRLEDILSRLCSPFEGDRKAEIDSALHQAHNLKGSAGAVGAGELAELAAKVHAAFPKLAEPGLEASRAAAGLAGTLVDMKVAIDGWAERAGAAEAPAPQPPETVRPPEQPQGVPEVEPHAAEKPEAQEESKAAAVAAPIDRTIRVSVNTLESLARQIENLTLNRARQERRARELQGQAVGAREILALCDQGLSALRAAGAESAACAPFEEVITRLKSLQRGLLRAGQESLREAEQSGLVSTVVREDLKDLRMVPASTVLEPLRRTVREVVGRVHKKVDYVIKGGDVRLDRRILDELKTPLLHMVRNSIDHGIESPDTRRALNKPELGKLEVCVERRGHRVAVVVSDDGGGLPVEKIRKGAVSRGIMPAAAAEALDEREVVRLIFRSGFSTAEQVTAISGRGVGLDVVHEAISRMGGTIDVDSKPGLGTRFTLELPLTLAATMAVIIRAGGELAAVPYESVERVLLLEPKEIGTIAGRASVVVDGSQVPFSSLAQVLGVPEGRLALERDEVQPALLLGITGGRVALAVEEVVGQQEIVVHALGRHAGKASHIGGAAVLDDGQVVAVLNSFELVKLAQPMSRKRDNAEAKRRILVADDSLTTRTAMKTLLEIAGFQVLPAGDGEEAWRLLQESSCQLVVSDVQMPRLDGLGLARRIRGDSRYATLPFILVTSLDSPADRAAGLEAGADGYLVKREVERGKLLELVRQLLPS